MKIGERQLSARELQIISALLPDALLDLKNKLGGEFSNMVGFESSEMDSVDSMPKHVQELQADVATVYNLIEDVREELVRMEEVKRHGQNYYLC